MPLAQPVMHPAMAVTRQPPHAKIVPSIMSPQGQGQLAQFVQMEPSPPRETHPAVLATLPAPLAMKPQQLVSPATSITSQELGLVVSSALLGHILQLEIPRVQHVMSPAMDVFRLQQHARTVQ